METPDEASSLLSASESQSATSIIVPEEVVLLDAVDPIVLSWKKLTVTANNGRVLLSDVSGLAQPGELLALMGASGAGKTTLLNAFLRRNLRGLHVEGDVEVNGRSIGRRITTISGYAQQQEMFIGTLTVREHLCIQARLRTTFPRERREKRVDAILSTLGLTKCQHNKIGIAGILKGISGGEARRLVFACELLSNPALLFCDEPTTGLDSFLAEHVVEVLSKLAKTRRTIVCTIHQPASQLFHMFDKVLFIANGRTAFYGTPQRCIEFFDDCGHSCPDSYNPADMIIHALAVVPHDEDASRSSITAICDAFESGPHGDSLAQELKKLGCTTVPQGRKQVWIFAQILTLLHRYTLDNWRNPALARAKLMQKIVMGLFIGLLYLQTPLTELGILNIMGALFLLTGELTYPTLFGILTLLPSDYQLVVKEYHDGMYYIFSYYIARILSYIPLFTIDGFLMVYICYWMIGLSSSLSQILLATLISFLIEQSAVAFGVMMSSICTSYPVAASISGPILVLLLLSGGFLAKISTLPSYIGWVQYLSWFRYGFEAFAINQWSHVNGDNTTWSEQRSQEILAHFSFKERNFWFDIMMMTAFTLIFYLIGYIGLCLRVMNAG